MELVKAPATVVTIVSLVIRIVILFVMIDVMIARQVIIPVQDIPA